MEAADLPATVTGLPVAVTGLPVAATGLPVAAAEPPVAVTISDRVSGLLRTISHI